MVEFAELGDLAVRAWFLAAKLGSVSDSNIGSAAQNKTDLVARETEDNEALVLVLVVQGLQA